MGDLPNTPRREPSLSNRTTHAALVILLTIHTLLLAWTATRSSACFDEGPHLSAGLAYWKFGETSIYNLSPPFLRYIAALPAYLTSPEIPPAKSFRSRDATSRHWQYFARYQQYNTTHLARDILLGRIALFPFSIALAWLIFRFSQNLYGNIAGLFCCTLWCFSPVVIANAATLGTDIGATCLIFFTVWTWFSFLESRKPRWLLIASGCFGLAIASKFTSVLLIPLLILTSLIAWRRKQISLKDCAAGVLICSSVGFVILNGFYRFRLMFYSVGSFSFQSHQMQMIAKILTAKLPLPFARDLIEGYDAQKWEAEGAYVSTLFDVSYFGSDWKYYPFMLACKLTVGGLVLGLLLALSVIQRRLNRAEISLLLTSLVFALGMVFLARINLGLRYLLPAFPPMIVLAGRLMETRRIRIVAVVAIALGGVETLSSAPRFHSFRNVASIPFEQHVSDRDWGQSLIELRRWMRNHQVDRIGLLNHSSINASVYQINAVDPNKIRTEYVAISRELLFGIPVRIESDFLFVRPWRELRVLRPIEDLGGLLVFRSADVEALGDPPWLVTVTSWDELRSEPTLLWPRNLR